MQIIKEKITLEFEWTFHDDGMLQRSNVVAGMQIEIRKNEITIYQRNGGIIYQGSHDGSRDARRKHAMKVVKRTLSS